MQTINVVTGFGYFKDSQDHIVSKAVLPVGEHPLMDGYTYTEVADQATLDAIQVYVDPVAAFNFKTLWGTVWAGALSATGLVELPPYAKTIEDMWFYPNRPAVYPFMQALVQAGKGTAGDLAIIVAAFSDQGIDIITIT